ncbi:MAG TPA: PDZ domain-containing protein [Phycisphaerales bacterium]|nr:PDZ domain-containing protein [Phycisphaerales bacterium]
MRIAFAGALLVGAAAMSGCIIVHDDHDDWESYRYYEAHRARPRIGVSVDTIGPAMASQLNVDRNRVTMIDSVYPGWPAAEAGMKRYDVITSVNGNDNASPDVVFATIRNSAPGEEVTFRVLRNGEPIDVRIAPTTVPPIQRDYK